jgi:16S rRNA A1518/A1519 N6-dimethyltransferase RsmA/KsgA/DIM1 with predicted DNA glycosylase/AP lyase activity
VERSVGPWALESLDLGSDVLEVGPGYGATAIVLRSRVAQLTCVEIDARPAADLRNRFDNESVSVLCEDGRCR